MNKVKTFALCTAYLLMLIVSLPFIVIGLICALVIYGALKIEVRTIEEIDDDELTDGWNAVAENFHECVNSVNDLFLMEMEL